MAFRYGKLVSPSRGEEHLDLQSQFALGSETQATNMEIRWIASHSASCFHAVELIARDVPIVDPAMDSAIQQSARDMIAELTAAHMPTARSLDHLVALSAGIDNNRQLAELLVSKIAGAG